MAKPFFQLIRVAKEWRMLNKKRIEEAVKKCLLKAGTTFRKDQLDAYRNAIRKEKNKNAKWVLERILENAKIAKKRALPLCDDTGIPHVFVEIGKGVTLPKDWLSAIHNGVAQGLRIMPGRPMAVKGNPVERVEQSKGLFKDPGKLSLAPVIVKSIAGDKFKITILLLGGGPEIRAKTYRVFHQRSIDVVLRKVAEWASSEMKNLGCTPCVLGIGIGRSHMEASILMLEAMKEGSLSRQSRLEQKITELVNLTKVGPLGLGGDTTALGTFIKIGPLRASGVRIVSMRPCCCLEPRKATVILGPD
jgi:fumarate hydratase subunit alpha